MRADSAAAEGATGTDDPYFTSALPDLAASPDRKRSRVSWSPHDSDSPASSGRAAASPHAAAGASPSQPQEATKSPQRKQPYRQSSSGPITRSQGSLQQSLAEHSTAPGSQHSSEAARRQVNRQPGSSAAPISTPDSMHNSSSSSSSDRDVPAAGSFQSFAVGRRFHPAAKVEAGQKACLQHQPGNAKDPNALMVVTCEEPGQVLGYLPATVAAILAGFVKEGAADVEVTVLERPKTPKASLPIIVQVGIPVLPEVSVEAQRRISYRVL